MSISNHRRPPRLIPPGALQVGGGALALASAAAIWLNADLGASAGTIAVPLGVLVPGGAGLALVGALVGRYADWAPPEVAPPRAPRASRRRVTTARVVSVGPPVPALPAPSDQAQVPWDSPSPAGRL